MLISEYTTGVVDRCNGITIRAAVSSLPVGITRVFPFHVKWMRCRFETIAVQHLFGVSPSIGFQSVSPLHPAQIAMAYMHNGGSVFTKNGTSIPRAELALSENI